MLKSDFACPSHQDTPYAFKFYAIKHAFEQGYSNVLWVDASFWAVKSIEGLFDLIDEKGFVCQGAGFSLGQWSSDECLDSFGITRKNAFRIPLLSGGLLGFNVQKERELFDDIFNYAKEGSLFKGSWTNRNGEISSDERVKGHRHDMSVISCMLKDRRDLILPNNSLFSYYKWYVSEKPDVYFVCEGGFREIE
jgi:hypothetical protein